MESIKNHLVIQTALFAKKNHNKTMFCFLLLQTKNPFNHSTSRNVVHGSFKISQFTLDIPLVDSKRS